MCTVTEIWSSGWQSDLRIGRQSVSIHCTVAWSKDAQESRQICWDFSAIQKKIQSNLSELLCSIKKNPKQVDHVFFLYRQNTLWVLFSINSPLASEPSYSFAFDQRTTKRVRQWSKNLHWLLIPVTVCVCVCLRASLNQKSWTHFSSRRCKNIQIYQKAKMSIFLFCSNWGKENFKNFFWNFEFFQSFLYSLTQANFIEKKS